jgi:ribonuclease HI
MGKNKEILDAELYAITEALKMANRYLIEDSHDTLAIYTDSAMALKKMKMSGPTAGQWIIRRISEREQIIRNAGGTVVYRWVPSHNDIEGNKKADAAAKSAAANPTLPGTTKLLNSEKFSSISHINRVTKEKRSNETKKWITETTGHRKNYSPPTLTKPDLITMASSKAIATRYYQLKIGHAVISRHLKRIGTIDDDRCWWCNSGERQSISHLIKECHKWKQAKKKLQKAFPKCIWNHNETQHIFNNRSKTAQMLEFLKETEMGNRRRFTER